MIVDAALEVHLVEREGLAAEDRAVDLAAVDVLLDEHGAALLAEQVRDARGQGGAVVDDGAGVDAVGGVVDRGLDDQREAEAVEHDGAGGVDDEAARDGDAVRGEQRLGLRLLLAQRQRHGPVAGVADAEELEDGGDVVLVLGVLTEPLDEVHHEVGLGALDRGDELAEVIPDVEQRGLVAAGLEHAHDQAQLVLDGLPRLDLERRVPFDRASALTTVVLVHVVVDLVPEDQDASHTAAPFYGYHRTREMSTMDNARERV